MGRRRGRGLRLHLAHQWTRGGGLTLPDLLYLIGVERTPRVRRQGLLFLREGHGRRRRRSFGDHRPALHRRGRLRHARSRRSNSRQTGFGGSNRGGGHHRRRPDGFGPHHNGCGLDRARAGERALLHRHDGSRRGAIHILHVHIRDIDVVIHDHRVGDIDAIEIDRTGVISRHVDLARPEREPGYSASHRAAANPRHQGGRIDRTHRHRTRHPAPIPVHISPAPVVKRRKSPGRVVHPGPAPRIHPDPMAVVIGRPSIGSAVGNPYGAVIGRVAPGSILVQVLISDQLARDIARRRRLVVALVAARAPGIHLIARRSSSGLIAGLIDADHLRLFAGLYGESLIRSGQLARASPHRHQGSGGIGLDVDPVFTGAQESEGQVGGVHLKAVLIA